MIASQFPNRICMPFRMYIDAEHFIKVNRCRKFGIGLVRTFQVGDRSGYSLGFVYCIERGHGNHFEVVSHRYVPGPRTFCFKVTSHTWLVFNYCEAAWLWDFVTLQHWHLLFIEWNKRNRIRINKRDDKVLVTVLMESRKSIISW